MKRCLLYTSKLTNKPVSEIAEELLTPEQLEMYRVYLETSGNKPLIFGGGSPDTGASEDLSGVQPVSYTHLRSAGKGLCRAYLTRLTNG